VDERQNVQLSTSNVQHPTGGTSDRGRRVGARGKNYDLEERLLNYACRIVRLVNKLPKTRAGNHVSKQLLRSGTSPLPNHGEAQAAESADDFVHKLRICLKELRESYRWLKLIDRIPLVRKPEDVDEVRSLIAETQELIRIFYTSIRTARTESPQERLPID
jgi:four helix bundle protein